MMIYSQSHKYVIIIILYYTHDRFTISLALSIFLSPRLIPSDLNTVKIIHFIKFLTSTSMHYHIFTTLKSKSFWRNCHVVSTSWWPMLFLAYYDQISTSTTLMKLPFLRSLESLVDKSSGHFAICMSLRPKQISTQVSAL
jgi:hypothetical protein